MYFTEGTFIMNKAIKILLVVLSVVVFIAASVSAMMLCSKKYKKNYITVCE